MPAGFLLIGAGIAGVAAIGLKGAGAASSAQAAVTSTVGGQTSSSAAPASGATFGQVSYGQVQAIGQAHGWTPAMINDWFHNLIPSESNGTLTDTNPGSGAYGIAQGITGPGWYAQHGGDAGTVNGQLTAMANYIAQRYKNPSAAWQFHLAHGWY